MTSQYNHKKAVRPKEALRLIARIRNQEKRNQLRGYSAKPHITSQDIEIIRRNNTPHDSAIVGALLKGKQGISNRKIANVKIKSSEIFTMTTFPPLGWKNEISYTAGYINTMASDVVSILDNIKKLAKLETIETKEALTTLLQISRKYGASNYLSYKLAYLRSARFLTAESLTIISEIEDEIGHRQSPGMHFSALENVSSKISLFVVAQRRIGGLVGRVEGDFRKALSLSNFIPTPLNLDDLPGFLLRATESSLIDTLYAIIVIFNIDQDFSPAQRELELRLDPHIKNKIKEAITSIGSLEDGILVTDEYISQNKDSSQSMDLYRTSAALLERPNLALYRNKLDREIGARLLAEIINGKICNSSKCVSDKEKILAPDDTPLNAPISIRLDAFYRTFLFLQFIKQKSNLIYLKKEEIKYIFENTVALEILLTEDEINTLYLTSPEESKSLVAVLALALFKSKSIDPDVDFKFRSNFISHVKSSHAGSISGFVNYLLKDSPEIASYIVGSLDEVTLEKLYTLVQNASEAAEIRSEILRSVGQRLNRIEYFVEADAITTRSKVSQLQKYFDSSRMYVDSVAMKKWLDSNPTVSTEQYRSLYPIVEARMPSGLDSNVIVIKINDQDEYLISQIATDAFEQFCLNAEFGIQSYLGRRIRHNTLDGVTTESVDTVLKKPEYAVALQTPAMRRIVENWMATYKSIIDKLRREQLQFKSNNSLFNSTLDENDPITKENIRNLCHALNAAGRSELLNDLLIAFCWKQITPQLENAARHIRTSVLQEANSAIDKYFLGHHGALEEEIKSGLHDAVNQVFKKVADWFQVPQTGFISASVRDLCQIILLELNRTNRVEFTGNAIDTKYTGISVHRLYDSLAVLLKNAQKHGEEGTSIHVNVESDQGAVLERLIVTITSTASQSEYEKSKDRIFKAIEDEETSKDMVTEGYTGIKKIKFITRMSEGFPTIACEANDVTRELKLTFRLHSEVAMGDFSGGGAQ